MSGSISWLHITDIHVGQSSSWMWERMRQQFLSDIEIVIKKCGRPWDVVFFSGDFVQNGGEDQYSQLNEELVKLWDYFKSLGANPLFLPIPGNQGGTGQSWET